MTSRDRSLPLLFACFFLSGLAALPLLARHAVRDEAQIGARVGLLYATNTAGAIAGTLATGFWLLPAIGLRATVLAAAGVNALVFAAAAPLARTAGAPPAAVPRNDPLRSEATRLRIEARLREGGPALAREAAELSESELGDRPTSRDLPVRAQAYAAGGEPAVALETVALLLNQLGREPGAHADLARGAGELALAMPAQGELRRARADTLRRLGL